MILTLRLSWHKFNEKFWFWLAWAMPKKLVYMCGIRLWAHGTTGQYADTVAPELTMDEAIRRWDK